jgi:hypothetical protein
VVTNHGPVQNSVHVVFTLPVVFFLDSEVTCETTLRRAKFLCFIPFSYCLVEDYISLPQNFGKPKHIQVPFPSFMNDPKLYNSSLCVTTRWLFIIPLKLKLI